MSVIERARGVKMITNPRICRCFARAVISLAVIALVVGTAGCDGCGYNPPPSQDLEIRDWYDLDDVRDNLEGHHTLMNDLDSATAGYEELASSTANGGKGWQPIGICHPYGHTACTGFMGTFDGQGYEIRDLFINRPDEDRVGLFKHVDDGVIEDIGVTNVTVIGGDGVGSLVGGGDSTVVNSYSAGSVSGHGHVGGLLGHTNGSVINSYSTSNVTGTDTVGGLVGQNSGTVSNSYSSANVIGGDIVGGLVGWNMGDVSNSYSIGSVIGHEYVGGLIGWNWGGVSNSYSTGSVTGSLSVGGLLGGNLGDNEEAGGVDNVSNSFWDTETSGQTASAGGTGKTTAEMQDIATFSGVGWNLIAVANPDTRNSSYVWNIVDGETYPFLSWQP